MHLRENSYGWLHNSGIFQDSGVVLIDANGAILDENNRIQALLKCKDSLIGMNIFELMPMPLHDSHKHYLNHVFSKPTGYLQQLTKPTAVNRCDGSTIDLMVSVVRLPDKDAQTAAVVLGQPEASHSLMERLFVSEQRFHSALQYLPVPAAMNDQSGNITFLNEAFVQKFGYNIADIPTLDHWWTKAYPNENYRTQVADEWSQLLAEARKTGTKPKPHEVIIRNGYGDDLHVLVQAATLEGDLFSEHMVTLQDITEIRTAEMNLKFQAEVLHNMQEGIHLVSVNSLKVVYANPRMEELFGYVSGEMIGLDVSQLNRGNAEQQQKMALSIAESLQQRGFWEGDVCNRRKDGSEFWCFARVKEVIHPEFGCCWVSIHQDITEQKKFHQMIWRQAHYDSLTNLPNRRLLEENIESEITQCEQASISFALMFMDIDNFKDINDLFGHQTGDSLLIEVGSRLEQTIRSSDFVSRFGGDEFVFLIRNIQTDRVGELQMLAEKIALAVSAPYYIAPETISITVSIGISIFPGDGKTTNELLSFSDQALYESKSKGKNQIRFFTENLQYIAARNRQLAEGLKDALKEDQFEVFYQPIVRTDTGECQKAEALLRWKHNGDYISPELFIPIAEDTGLIHEIGHFVFERVMEDLQTLESKGYEHIQLSLNKSVLQMSSGRVATEKIWPFLMKDKGLDPSRICIELTESSELTSSHLINRKFTRLRQAGFNFAIDDFGTGYTSLGHMASFQFQFTKIDRSFITDIETDTHRRDLTEGMIALSQKLRMKVIAEGVETTEQAKILAGFGCDYLQGYWISRPMPFSDFLEWLDQHGRKSHSSDREH